MNIALDFDDVLIVPTRTNMSSRSEPNIYNIDGFVPIMCANMTSVASLRMAKTLHNNRFMSCLHKFYSPQQISDYLKEDTTRIKSTFITFGMESNSLDKLKQISDTLETDALLICLDVANGYQMAFHNRVSEIASTFPKSKIMAGNVVTEQGVIDLTNAGAKIIKIGIGSGAACLTRRMTGVGYPQYSAVYECARAAYKRNVQICSDGGHVVVGDICKALVGGASYVMLGSMLAGHVECVEDGESLNKIPFYGMSSDFANEEFAGGLKSYRTSEGRQLILDNKGSVVRTLNEIEGGLRSCMTYTDSSTLTQLRSALVTRVHSQLNRSLEKFE